MAEQQLIEYIKQRQADGASRQDINGRLLAEGWLQPQIDEAFAKALSRATENYTAPALESSVGKNEARFSKKDKVPVKNILLGALVFAVLVLAAVGGIFVYDNFFPSPARVMEKMAVAMSKIKTIESQGKTKVELSYAGYDSGAAESDEKQKINVGVEFFGALDMSNDDESKYSLNSKITAPPILNGSIDAGVVSIGKTAYFKINADSSSYASMVSDFFNDQWIKIDYDKFVAQMDKLYPNLKENMEKNAAKVTAPTPGQIEKLRALAKNSHLIIPKKQFADALVNGVVCRHYTVGIDKEALRKFIRDAGEILRDKIAQQQVGAIVDVANGADFSEMEVWIAKNDFTLRRIKGAIAAKYDFFGFTQIMIGIDIDINCKKINQPVIISAPKQSKPFEDVIKSSLQGSQIKARDAKRQSDMRQLVSAQEMWYGDKDRYYICGESGGDCKGKPDNLPESIDPYINDLPEDPLNKGTVCGQDYIYCGLNNVGEKEKFCFYAKLEGGGYYTSSHAGNVKRVAAPKTLDECAKAD